MPVNSLMYLIQNTIYLRLKDFCKGEQKQLHALSRVSMQLNKKKTAYEMTEMGFESAII